MKPIILPKLVLLFLVVSPLAHAGDFVFPADPRAVIDVKRDCGAKGDGIADDTAALQSAIDRSSAQDYTRTIYLPNGTYKITKTIVFRGPDWQKGVEGYGIGPWLWGQNRDKTIIKLADGAEGFQDPSKPLEAVRGLSRPDGARMNADFFDRMVVNLTIDTGNNPGAVGIKFYSNNTGEMRDVRIEGHGAVGLDLGFCDQNGPLLIQDVEVDGFATGISTDRILNSQTLSRVTIRNASKVGLLHRGQMLAIEGLHVVNAPLAIDTAGVLTLLDSDLEASRDATGPAIKLGDGHLYAARVTTKGFASAIAAAKAPAGNVAGPEITEYSSHGFETLGEGSPKKGLLMRPEREPDVPFPTQAKDWVCANDFGAKAGDEEDDSGAIQKAIDTAAERGASTVYLLGGKRGDPNWYRLAHDIRIHGSVQRIMGFGFARLLAAAGPGGARNRGNPPLFIVEDDPKAPKTLIFQCLHVFGGGGFGIDVRSPHRTVVIRAGDGRLTAREDTKVFLSNCVGRMALDKGATIWARQWNTEGGGRGPVSNTQNDGGQLWILGMKTEGVSTKVSSLHGGRTEVLGVHNYNYTGARDDTPFALVEDATLSIAGYREVNFNNGWWKVPVLARFGGTESRYPQRAWETWSLLRIGP
jgi:hypothetical protein